MAQAGTNCAVHLNVGDVFVAPYNSRVTAAAAALGTAGTTATSIAVNHNGVASGLAPTVAANATVGALLTAPFTAPLLTLTAGDSVTLTATYGTSAVGGSVTLGVDRAV